MVLLDHTYTAAFQNEIPRNKVQLAATLENTHIDYIFLGSSRVENHIDCDLITKITGKSCLNLGLQGSRINDAKALVLLLESNNITYEKLLMQVDYIYNFNNYSPSLISGIVPFVTKRSFPRELKEDLNLPISYNIPFVRFAYNDKLSGLREVLMQFVGKKPSIDLSNGYNPLEGVGQKVSGEFPNQIAATNSGLDELLAINNNRIILFTAPYCKNTGNREDFMEVLIKRYPNLKNFSAIFDEEEQYYSNCGHLNKEGAAKFTEILTKDILLN